MNLINLGRRNGKTVMLVHTSFVTGAPIITSSFGMKTNVKTVANTLGINIEVYTYEEFMQMHRKNCPILIDEAEPIIKKALEAYFGNEVIGATFTLPMYEIAKKENKSDAESI